MKELSSAERQALIIGLQMRCGYIETGDPALRAGDVSSGHVGTIKALSVDQMRLILLQEDLIKAVSDGRLCWK